MARDWENREGNRNHGDRNDQWRSGRDWSDRAGDEMRSWFGDEDAERRRMMDDRSRGERENRGWSGGGDWREDRPAGMRSSAERGYAGGDRFRSGGFDRDMYGYPRRQSDERDYRARDGGSGWDPDRGFFERAGDEVASWFGDDDAQRRREMDARYRGRGPKNYTRSDERIAEDVNDRLADDAHIDATDIEVSVSGGEVTLNGTVTERFAKRRAEDVAERVSGVKHVQNNLRVSGQQAASSATTTRTNATGTGPAAEAGTTFRH